MSSVEPAKALEIIDFWLSAGAEAWFTQSDQFDKACADWVPMWEEARDGGCDDWANTAAGSLALIVLLDQIPRNVFRGSPQQFATDEKALTVAEAAVSAGHDRTQAMPVRFFYYLPFEHAEDVAAQTRCLDLIRPLKNQEFYYWALVHADAITRFGRFPHRNKVLGRETTEAERIYLETGGFGA